MERVRIGKVVQMDADSVIVEVIDNSYVDKVNFSIGISVVPVVINKLISVKLLNSKEVVLKINKIYDKNHFINRDDFKVHNSKIFLEATPLGIYDSYLYKFDEGINNYPLINTEVYSISSETKKSIINISSTYKLQVGNSFGNDDLVNEANPDILLGKHLGVFGNTGSGKSCTVTSIIQGLKRRLYTSSGTDVSIKPKIIIFDSNDEYAQAFNDTEFRYKKISKSKLKLSHTKLSDSEYFKFFGASQGVQAPLLKQALTKLRPNGFFSLQDIINMINDLISTNSRELDRNGNKTRSNFSFNQWTNWTNTMINRIERIIENNELKLIIDDHAVNTIDQIFDDNSNEIFLIDSDFDREELDIVMFLFAKLVYKKYQTDGPNIILVLEEAHRYINDYDNKDYKLGNYYIEKIAREGRKFGISLVISSQRPSELSKTVISQCNSYIIHKLTNKHDIEIVSRFLSYNSREYVNSLTSLERQHALICGEAFGFPDITRIFNASPTPNSNDPEIVKNWLED